MLTSFVLSMALAAPVPAPPPPVANGPLPRLMELKADASGKVIVQVMRTEMQKVQVGAGAAIGPNGAPPAVITREFPVTKSVQVELSEVKDLAITTADGKKVEVADAVAKVKNGATVVVSADGKPVSPNHLKLFKDDVLVLASQELAGTTGFTGGPNVLPVFPGGKPIRPLPPIQVQPLPALPALPPVGAPGVIQIQIAPGGVQVLPAPAVEPAEKLPPKEEKK
jgi:hypothetical protein